MGWVSGDWVMYAKVHQLSYWNRRCKFTVFDLSDDVAPEWVASDDLWVGCDAGACWTDGIFGASRK